MAKYQGPPVRILAALIDPIGHDAGGETVTLVNLTSEPVDMDGWSLVDGHDRKHVLDHFQIEAGETVRVWLDAGTVQLANNGGKIRLCDDEGAEVHAVEYSKADVPGAGETLLFG